MNVAPASSRSVAASSSSSPSWSPGTSLAAAAVIVLWAAAFVGVKVALVDLAPGQLALARYAVAALVFAVLLFARRCVVPPLGDALRMAAGGAIGIALYNFTLNSGQQTVSAGVASLLVNTVPIWTSVLSVAALHERIGKGEWVGAFVSFGGVALISLEHGGWTGLGPGTLLVLAAALSQAAYFVIIKPLLERYHPIDLTSYAVWFGFLFLLPFHDGIVESLRTSSPTTKVAVVFLGVGPAALAYLAWSYVLKQRPAGSAANLLYLVPVVALGLGWAVLDESPSAVALLGGSIALLGVGLHRRSRR